MGRHWGGVQSQLHGVHPVGDARTTTDTEPSGTATERKDKIQIPSLVGKAEDTSGHDLAHEANSEDEDDLPAAPVSPSEDEREAIVMRKYLRKWWRLAGMQGHPGMLEGVNGGTEGVNCTKGICPRVEGRIRCLGAKF